MSRIKFTLSGLLMAFLLLSSSVYGRDPKLTLLYKGKPLCYWNVTIGKGDAVYGTGVTDDHGVVIFKGAKMLTAAFDLKGDKSTANGNKNWSVRGMFAFNDDTYTATIEFAEVAAQIASFMGISEASLLTGWGIMGDSCDEKPTSTSSNSGSTSGTNSSNSTPGTGSDNNSGNSTTVKNDPPEKSLEEKMAEMKAQREQNQAESKEQRAQQKVALEQKVQRLNKKVEEAKAEQAKHTAGTKAHSDASYELRDLEIDRDLTQMKLDKMGDQDANTNGMLSKSERQRYNDKTDALEAEQKELRKNKKDGKMYGQGAEVAAETGSGDKSGDKKGKEDEEDDSKLKFYTPEELTNMSSFDLKRTKLSNNQSINKRKVRLKTKAAFLSVDEKAKTQVEIDDLTKQVDAIKIVLEKRNEKEE